MGGLQVSTAGHPWKKLIRTPFEVPTSLVSFTGKVRSDSEDPSTVYTLLAGRHWKSADDGRTWSTFGNGPGAPLLNDLAFDPADPGLLYAVSSSGVFRSGDGGVSWAALRGTAFNTLALPRPGTILAGGCGIGRSTNGGRTWRDVLSCKPQGRLSSRSIEKLWVHPVARDEVYAAGFEYGRTSAARVVYGSSDGGATWRRLLTGTNALALDPTHRGTLYAVQGNNLLKSMNNGQDLEPDRIARDRLRPDLRPRRRPGKPLDSLRGLRVLLPWPAPQPGRRQDLGTGRHAVLRVRHHRSVPASGRAAPLPHRRLGRVV